MSPQPNPEPHFDIFWGELAPCEHLVQMYEDDDIFLDALEGFVAGGLRSGDSAIVIATSLHLNTLEERLQAGGVDLIAALAQDRYIPLDAAETISKFVVDGWPDEERFNVVISEIIHRARRHGRRVRAFGEMVALMWHQGFQEGTVRLEQLWHALCQREAFSLFCAYPRSGFTEDALSSLQTICDTHSRVISGGRKLGPWGTPFPRIN